MQIDNSFCLVLFTSDNERGAALCGKNKVDECKEYILSHFEVVEILGVEEYNKHRVLSSTDKVKLLVCVDWL